MPDFFFHLTNGTPIKDDRPTRCGTVEEAKAFAAALAAELGRNRSSKEIDHLAISVTDQDGTEVFKTQVVNLQRTAKADEMTDAARHQASGRTADE
jgi:Domain of unknown function (DUF6894)